MWTSSDRTAGILALVRPCGIIVNLSEMFTCESVTQAYVFIFTTFGRSLEDLDRLKYLGYNRTCDLHPFLKKLKKRGSIGAKILLGNVKFMVNLWHCNKHREATCIPPDNPKCKYHPKLEKFSEVHGVNTECAEQASKWLGKFKLVTRWHAIGIAFSYGRSLMNTTSWTFLTYAELLNNCYSYFNTTVRTKVCNSILTLAILIKQCVMCLHIHVCMLICLSFELQLHVHVQAVTI